MATPEEQAEWLQRITLDGYGERFIECADLIRSQQSKLGPLQTHYDNAPPDYVKRLVLRVEEEERKRKAAECRLQGALKDAEEQRLAADTIKAYLDDSDKRERALTSRLDSARAAFRKADGKNDWCDATKESWPVNSDAWLEIEDALFAGVVERQK